jgi:hypothetical protein
VPRNLKITLAILAVAVLIGLISLRSLQKRLQRLAQAPTTEEQARRDLLKPPISTPTDVVAQIPIFWAAGPDRRSGETRAASNRRADPANSQL